MPWEGAFAPSGLYGKKATQVCPCGYYGDPVKECRCSPAEVARYQKRISGPLLDRIDIFIEVPHIDYEKLANDHLGENSEGIRTRVKTARDIQQRRLGRNKTHLQCGDDPGGNRPLLFPGIHGPESPQDSYETTSSFCPGFPPHLESSPALSLTYLVPRVSAWSTWRKRCSIDPEASVGSAHHRSMVSGSTGMSHYRQKEYVDWIESARRDETRAIRIEKALTMLATGKKLRGGEFYK